MTTDPFDALLRPSSPRRPRMEFAVDLRRRIEEELGMTSTDHLQDNQPDAGEAYEIWPKMIHLRVNDANQAMSFFGRLFDWEGDRFEADQRASHYRVLPRRVRQAPSLSPGAAALLFRERHHGRRGGAGQNHQRARAAFLPRRRPPIGQFPSQEV